MNVYIASCAGMGQLSRHVDFALSAVLLLLVSAADAQPVCTFATLYSSDYAVPVANIGWPMIAGANGQVVGSATLYANGPSITFEVTTTEGVWGDRVRWYIYDSEASFRQDYLQVTLRGFTAAPCTPAPDTRD